MARTSTTRPVLVVTADPALVDSVSRLAAAAGAGLAVAGDPDEALRCWPAAAMVLVGPDQVDALAARSTPRRPELQVVAVGQVPDRVYRSALRLGAQSVLELPGAGPWLLGALADLSEASAPPGRSIAVVGASGGAGASVFAASLAAVASRGDDVLLVDLDPFGPGQRQLVGHEDEAGISWHDLAASTGRLGAGSLREAVPRRQRLGVLGWSDDRRAPVPPAVVEEAVAAAVRGHGWVVVDVPRRWDEEVRTVLSACDQTVLVARARIGCLPAAARFAHLVRAELPGTGLVVRTRREAPPSEEVARALGLELWAQMRDERRLDEHLALGLGPAYASRGALARAASAVLTRCSGAAAPVRGRVAA